MWCFIVTLLLLLIISIFAFAGCSAPDGRVPDSGNGGSGTTEQGLILTDPTRKIIYTVDIRIKTKDLIGTTNEIKARFRKNKEVKKEEEPKENQDK